jgi:hypothetical protein
MKIQTEKSANKRNGGSFFSSSVYLYIHEANVIEIMYIQRLFEF